MPTYLSPGVYIEEVPAGSRPIEGVGTAVAAFVGLAAKGDFNKPTLVSNWSQFTQTFGDFVEGSYLAHSVYAYFANGGGNCYIVRVGADGNGNGNGHANGSSSKPAEVTASAPAQLEAAPRRRSAATRSSPARSSRARCRMASRYQPVGPKCVQ